MNVLKLALPSTGLLFAGKALAHNGSRVHAGIPSASCPGPAPAGAGAIALLGGGTGFAVPGALTGARSTTFQPSSARHRSKPHINHRH